VKPHYQIAIAECGEPLVPIPSEQFSLVIPHAYQALGAPYGDQSPFYVRQGVLERLRLAQTYLQQDYPNWQIQIADAYRPIAVQQFMVDYTAQELAQAQGYLLDNLTLEQRQAILAQVYEFWAPPSSNPATPPPHSTGGAIDVTLVDQAGVAIAMGSQIDEISPRSYPDHFARCLDPQGQQYHQHRQVLRQVMLTAGFQQHQNEWWHFCYGDQMWAWLSNASHADKTTIARYGSV
jgi:D-alanyl-D-alanine dipeptidase